jgi:hypothetical protein
MAALLVSSKVPSTTYLMLGVSQVKEFHDSLHILAHYNFSANSWPSNYAAGLFALSIVILKPTFRTKFSKTKNHPFLLSLEGYWDQ